VVAHDAVNDPDTCEFAGGYLEPHGITSMLDAPIRRSGQVFGVVCHEHVGPARVWADDEQEFSASVADFVALALETAERRRAQQAFRSAQEELLRQQWQANKQFEFELDKVRQKLVQNTRLAAAGQIAASLAHDLREPFAALQDAVRDLERRLAGGDGKVAEDLAIMEHEIRVADATVDNLLDLSDSREPSKVSVDLRASIDAAFRHVESLAVALRLDVDLDPDPYTVRADREQLRQVLTNLMNNSATATEGRGTITVRARRRGGHDEIEVEDDGPGIPAAIRDQVFEPLFTTRARGTGLGLAICRQIVEGHGGTIKLARGSSRGATVRLRLPAPTG
jgi:signal transduction histidine kinase